MLAIASGFIAIRHLIGKFAYTRLLARASLTGSINFLKHLLRAGFGTDPSLRVNSEGNFVESDQDCATNR